MLRIYDPAGTEAFLHGHLVFVSARQVLEVSEHAVDRFTAQRCTLQERDNVHLLKGKSRQDKAGAVSKKPGYTLHRSACAVTLQVAGEMGSLVA